MNQSVQETFNFAIEELGLGGNALCCHASMRSLDGRPRTGDLIDSLLAAGSTLMVPTFTYHYELPAPDDDRPANNGMTYDQAVHPHLTPFIASGNELTRSAMGALPAAVLAVSGRSRGEHPLNSFSAIGPLATRLVTEQSAEDVYAPFRALLAENGKLLLLGTDTTSLTFVHFAEQQAGRRLFVRWAHGPNGEVRRVRVGGCSNGFGKLMPIVRQVGRETRCMGASWIAADAGALLERLVAAIKAEPGITHCDDSACERCNDAIKGGPE